MKRPVDIIMLILAITVCLSVLSALVVELLYPESVDSDILGQIILALVAIISLYVGSKLKIKD